MLMINWKIVTVAEKCWWNNSSIAKINLSFWNLKKKLKKNYSCEMNHSINFIFLNFLDYVQIFEVTSKLLVFELLMQRSLSILWQYVYQLLFFFDMFCLYNFCKDFIYLCISCNWSTSVPQNALLLLTKSYQKSIPLYVKNTFYWLFFERTFSWVDANNDLMNWYLCIKSGKC